MKLFSKAEPQASALVITMFVIFLITISIGIAMNVTTSTVRQTDTSRDFSALRSATEGALDFGYGLWAKQINNKSRPVKAAEVTVDTPPTFAGLTYKTALSIQGTDQYGSPITATATPPPIRINLDKYPGWIGANTSYVANVCLEGTFNGNRKVPYAVKRSFNYTVVPLFQATAFFENDLELFRPATMTIGGLVHTNNQAYVSSSSAGELTFTGHLSFAGKDGYHDDIDPPKANTWTGWVANSEMPPTYAGGGKDQQIEQVSRIEPLGADANTLLDTTDTNRNNDTAREMIEPPNTYVDPVTHAIKTADTSASDPATIGSRRLYNKAGIRIRMSGSASSPTITITPEVGSTLNGTSLTAAQRNAITNALSQETIYDRREGKNVGLTSVDISKVRGTLDAATGFNNIVYIDDIRATTTQDTTTSDPQKKSVDPRGIRLVNGDTLPGDGLTVASENAVYIEGDYNTKGSRVPSAVFADAVTILSNDWKDNKSADALSARKAKDTTVNTAIVAGFMPSGWTDPANPGAAPYGYSGGLNNFPRFLEDWSGKTFKYTGSMIQLFTSAIATGQWNTGPNYAPPTRIWNFDLNFVDNPPPGSLDAVAVSRGPLVRYTP